MANNQRPNARGIPLPPGPLPTHQTFTNLLSNFRGLTVDDRRQAAAQVQYGIPPEVRREIDEQILDRAAEVLRHAVFPLVESMNIDRDSVRNMLVREYNRWAGDYTGPINFGGDDDDDDSGGDDNGNGDEMDVDEGLRGMGLSSGSDESNGHGDKENENPDGDSGLARPAVARNAIPSPLSPTNKGFSDLDKENTGSNLNTAWQHIDGDTLTNNDTDGSAKKKSKTDMVPEHGTVEEGVKKNATMPNGSQDHSRTEDIDENTTMTTATEADLTNEDATSGAAEEEVPENKMSLIVKLKVDRGGNMDARSAYYERQRKAGKFWKRNVCVAKIQYTPGTQLPGYDKHGKALEPIGKK